MHRSLWEWLKKPLQQNVVGCWSCLLCDNRKFINLLRISQIWKMDKSDMGITSALCHFLICMYHTKIYYLWNFIAILTTRIGCNMFGNINVSLACARWSIKVLIRLNYHKNKWQTGVLYLGCNRKYLIMITVIITHLFVWLNNPPTTKLLSFWHLQILKYQK